MAKKDITHKNLKESFSQFATGVMVATTSYKGENYGLTISSFSSVSLDPALVLFSIDNSSYNLKFFKKSKKFCLNVLSRDQINLARGFADKKNLNKWNIEKFGFSENKNPVFENCLTFIDCVKFKTKKVGDHHIFIGRVVELDKVKSENPLLYFRGDLF